MSEDIKLEVIKTTQNSLSKYIKKPPLTEKLLRKPPFRYLHDITTSVMKETGYLQGLYSQDELNPENIKDREAKIAFLEKLIAAVNLSTGVNITARPNKIVAGLDVAKTNELLQTIARALDKKVDSSKAVEQVLNKKSKGVNQQKKENSKGSKETKTNESKSREPHNSDTLKKKTRDKIKSVEKTDTKKVKQKKDISPTKIRKAPSVEEPSIGAVNDDSKSQGGKLPEPQASLEVEEPANPQNIPDKGHQSPEPKHDVKPPPSLTPVSLDPMTEPESKEEVKTKPEIVTVQDSKPQPLKDVQEVKHVNESNTKPEEELKRPQSARAVHRKKAAKKPNAEVDDNSSSKITDNREEKLHKERVAVEEVADKKSVHSDTSKSDSIGTRESKRPRTANRPASARPGAPRVRDRGTILLTDNDNKEVSEPVNLIVDSKELPKDDDESLVTVEAPVTEIVVDQVLDDSTLLSGDQGHLVSQILETQKELEDTSIAGTTTETVQKVDINWGTGRQVAVSREVEKLRNAIQSLTRAVNPLGKLIDFLQEDIDSMQTELENWVTTNRQLEQQLQAEERLTDESVEPLTRQLEDIEQLVEEQLEEMSVVKAAIIRNDERLAKLLKTNTSHLPG